MCVLEGSMGYKELVESLEKMLPPKIPYGELVGAPWPYTGQGEMVYEDPEPYFIEQAITAINDLLARSESAEARAEKAEKERDAAVKMLRKIEWCNGCKNFRGMQGRRIGALVTCNPQNDMYVFGEGEE